MRVRTIVVVILLAAILGLAMAAVKARAATRLEVPASAGQLLVVSSPTSDPPGGVATLRAYSRSGAGAPWRQTFGPWPAETGAGHLLAAAARREGDHATPIGVFGIGLTMYGNQPNPGGLHYAYHQLGCGDWWDEDPYSSRYNQFVQAPCGRTPKFAGWSEALWESPVAYSYLAVIRFNMSPTIRGSGARGSGIFLHNWVGAPTEGCVALHRSELLAVLRWLQPAEHPVVEIGTTGQLASVSQAG